MHLFGLILCGFIASFWVFYGLHIAYGALRLPIIKDIAPAADADCPNISILFAARDEQEKLAAALATLMEIEYPHFEVVAGVGRSSDWPRPRPGCFSPPPPPASAFFFFSLSPG